jgi:hypothetical protein
MSNLIDNYTSFNDDMARVANSAFYSEDFVPYSRSYSIILHNNNDSKYCSLLNQRELSLLDEFENLKDNWDGELSKAPSFNSILKARFILKILQATGQKVFHVAPGPNGEIMIDIRKNNKSIELLFYNDMVKYVTFPADESPVQGIFELNILPELLQWLNA